MNETLVLILYVMSIGIVYVFNWAVSCRGTGIACNDFDRVRLPDGPLEEKDDKRIGKQPLC